MFGLGVVTGIDGWQIAIYHETERLRAESTGARIENLVAQAGILIGSLCKWSNIPTRVSVEMTVAYKTLMVRLFVMRWVSCGP